jgi:hypothetical protein
MAQSALLAGDTAARVAVAPAGEAGLERAAEAVWVAAQGTRWSSLVIVPAETGISAVALARAVAAVGSAQRGEPVDGIDLRGLPLSESRAHVERLADRSQPFRRVALLDCPLDSQAALLLAQSADAAVLVVERERTPLETARKVIAKLGQERFVGVVVAEPPRR